MPKHARVAILMLAMVIFAMAMLNLVRSKVTTNSRAFRSAAIQYSTLRRIYTAPGDSIRGTIAPQDKRQ